MPLTQETSVERDGGASARKILAIDIGGTKVKMLLNGATASRKVPSGLAFTPPKLVAAVKETAADWHYDAISIGYPGLTGLHGPLAGPAALKLWPDLIEDVESHLRFRFDI